MAATSKYRFLVTVSCVARKVFDIAYNSCTRPPDLPRISASWYYCDIQALRFNQIMTSGSALFRGADQEEYRQLAWVRRHLRQS
jgi:hypothetical protein